MKSEKIFMGVLITQLAIALLFELSLVMEDRLTNKSPLIILGVNLLLLISSISTTQGFYKNNPKNRRRVLMGLMFLSIFFPTLFVIVMGIFPGRLYWDSFTISMVSIMTLGI